MITASPDLGFHGSAEMPLKEQLRGVTIDRGRV